MANVERRVDVVVGFINVDLDFGLYVFGGDFAACVVHAIFDFILIMTCAFGSFSAFGSRGRMARNSSVNSVSVVTVFNFLFLAANEDFGEAFFCCGSVLYPTKAVFRGSIASISKQR